ncbi:MAG: DUF3394 domain-containing protein, partial [Methyloligellaceae bacterium]
LAVVVIGLFRPDALMNRIFPEYSELSLQEIVSGSNSRLPADRAVRLHVTRETEYGDRFKLFVIPKDKSKISDSENFSQRFGVSFELENDGRLNVSNTKFNGPAESAGITFGDYITAIDIEQLDRPAKEWVYPFGFAILLIVYLLQKAKFRKHQLKISDAV